MIVKVDPENFFQIAFPNLTIDVKTNSDEQYTLGSEHEIP